MKAHYVRGLMLEQQGRAEEALEAYNQALEGDPAHLGALDRKGAIHDARGEFEGSLDCARRFIEIDGRNAGAHRNLGLMLREMGKFEEAERSLRAAISLDPGLENAASHLALVLIDQGRLDEAERILSDVLSAAPDHVEGRWTSALIYLQQGRFDVGWDLYESREARRGASQRRGAVPEWDGRSAPDGPLLIYSEQGLGDEIMFASCFNDVLRLAPSCIIECEPRLERLFRRSFPAAAILPGAGARGLPPVAAQIATGSLPGHFRRSWSDFPRHSGYLVPEPAKVAAWRERLRGLGPGLKAGSAWTGGALKTRRRLRSIELRQLLPIVSSDQARFVSLQYVESAAEIAAFNETHGPVIHHWPEATGDYDETAALVAALDVVISVSTAVVHLAGALGKPVWVMVPAAPEWRYLRRGDAMPWYPSARLWRQQRLGDWEPVIAGIREALVTFRAAC